MNKYDPLTTRSGKYNQVLREQINYQRVNVEIQDTSYSTTEHILDFLRRFLFGCLIYATIAYMLTVKHTLNIVFVTSTSLMFAMVYPANIQLPQDKIYASLIFILHVLTSVALISLRLIN